jgi:hypothetical protein
VPLPPSCDAIACCWSKIWRPTVERGRKAKRARRRVCCHYALSPGVSTRTRATEQAAVSCQSAATTQDRVWRLLRHRAAGNDGGREAPRVSAASHATRRCSRGRC